MIGAQGLKGGEAAHNLTTAELAAHAHDYVSARDRGVPLVSWPFNGYITNMADSGSGVYVMRTDDINTISEGLNTANAGSNAGHNTLQPTYVDNYIIRLK